MKNLKLIIIGYGRHGKDTVCEILEKQYEYSFKSSSEFCAEHVVYPILKNTYGYESYKECYEDRHNHRVEWFNIISDYNKEDLARLGRYILAEYSIYCGLRRRDELDALKQQNICDFVIWVDASQRLPIEDSSSCTVGPDQADYIIDNNYDLNHLNEEIGKFISYISTVHN